MSFDIFGHGKSISSMLDNNTSNNSNNTTANLFNGAEIMDRADPFNTRNKIDFTGIGKLPALKPDDNWNDKSDIKFVSLILTELPAYSESQQIGKRDLTSRISQQTYSRINEELNSCPTGKLTNENLSKMGMDILSVSSVPVSQVDIINGWSTKRHAFMLVLDVNTTFKSVRKVISGFTDDSGKISLGFGDSSTIADDLRFTINNITTFNMNANRATGKTTVTTDSIEHLVSSTGSGFGTSSGSAVVNPYSILTSISDRLESENDYEVSTVGIYPSTAGVLIRREFDHPLSTTKEVINSYHDSLSVSNPSDNMATIYQRAAANHSLTRSVSDPFLRMICNANNTSQSFIWSQLKGWFNEAYSKMKYVKADIKNSLTSISSGWNYSTYSAQVAYLISQIVPPVMLKYGILSYGIVLSNKNRDPFTRKCDLACTPTQSPAGFYDTNNPQEVIRIIEAINTEIINDLGKMISFGNEIQVNAHISYSATMSMFIRLSLGDGFGAEEDFVFPAYASSKFSTSITNNYSTVTDVSTNFMGLIDHLDTPNKIKNSMNSTFNQVDLFSNNSNTIHSVDTAGFSADFFKG